MVLVLYFLQSTKSRRLRSDDVDAVGRLSILNETYYRDILLEMGGMFSIANRVDNVHKRPWIGFQSWRAAARKVGCIIWGVSVCPHVCYLPLIFLSH